jgi:hypothetical protein
MKYYILILTNVLLFNFKAQIKTIYAIGGNGFIDWTKEKAKVNEDDNPFLYGSGCTEGPSKARVSSTLSSQGNNYYGSSNLYDWDPQTAWVEGKSDYGIGEFFEIDLPYGGSNIGIFNGYQKSYESWLNNSRVKKFKVYVDGKAVCYAVLKDLMGYQTINLPIDYLGNHTNFRFEIMEVYPGAKWKDVAISEICNIGCCINAETWIESSNGNILAKDLQPGDKIKTIEPQSNLVVERPIIEKIEIQHNKLILLQTNSHSIEMTSYHPLYFKGIGLSSLLEIMKAKELSNLLELVNEVEVLVWNEECQETTYEKITSIEVIEGDFRTYSILDIEHASTYIANGFVTTTQGLKKQ